MEDRRHTAILVAVALVAPLIVLVWQLGDHGSTIGPPSRGSASIVLGTPSVGSPASPGDAAPQLSPSAWPTPFDGPRPAALAFADAGRGYAVDDSGFWTTEDGGATWASTQPRLGTLRFGGPRAMAVSGDNIWVALSETVRGEWLVGSSDRGASWRSLARGKSLSLSFVSATDGYAVRVVRDSSRSSTHAEQDGVFRSRDGGRTWQPVGDPRPCGPWNPTSVSFANSGRGWLYCEDDVGYRPGWHAILETTDGGTSWTRRAGADTADVIDLAGPGGVIAMAPDGSGLVSTLTCHLAVTGDAWRTSFSRTMSNGAECNLWTIAVAPDGSRYVVTSGMASPYSIETRLLRSRDLGWTWQLAGTLHVEVLPWPD